MIGVNVKKFLQFYLFACTLKIVAVTNAKENQTSATIETQSIEISRSNDYSKLLDNVENNFKKQEVNESNVFLKLSQFEDSESNLSNETTDKVIWKSHEDVEHTISNDADDDDDYGYNENEDYIDEDDFYSYNNKTTRAGCKCKCGLRNVKRIVGGHRADKWEYPWQLGLIYKGSVICGASLLSNRYAMTAAHCTVNLPFSLSQVRISFKLWNQRRPKLSKAFRRKIIRVHRAGYEANKNNRDIAILQFRAVPLSKRLSPICLPKPKSVYDGKIGIVTGWGTIRSGGRQPNYLQEVKVRFLSNKECAAKYRGTGTKITKYMVCAGRPGKDSCQGDSGGPLVTIQKGRYRLAGAVSFGIGCGGKYPGVYARIDQFLPLIRSLIKDSCTCQGNIYV